MNSNLSDGEHVMVFHQGLWMHAIYVSACESGHRVRIGKQRVEVPSVNRRSRYIRQEEKERKEVQTREKRNYGRI